MVSEQSKTVIECAGLERDRWYAVERPHVPAPRMRIDLGSGVSEGFVSFIESCKV